MPVVAVVFRRLLAAAALRFAHRQATRMLRADPTPRGPLIAVAVSITLITVTAALGSERGSSSAGGAHPTVAHSASELTAS